VWNKDATPLCGWFVKHAGVGSAASVTEVMFRKRYFLSSSICCLPWHPVRSAGRIAEGPSRHSAYLIAPASDILIGSAVFVALTSVPTA